MAALNRPAPIVSPHNEPYFTGASRGVLRIRRCDACEGYVFFPRIVCAYCLSTETLRWVDAAGRGEVYSYCIVHRPQDPAFYGEAPITFAAVRLREGPTMLSELHNVNPEDVRIGMSVEARFVRITDGVAVPVWVPRPE